MATDLLTNHVKSLDGTLYKVYIIKADTLVLK